MSYDPCEEDPASTLLRPHLQVRKSTLSRRSNASILGSFGIKYDEGVEGCKECVGGTLGTEQSSRIGARQPRATCATAVQSFHYCGSTSMTA